MGVKIEEQGDQLIARYHPERSATIAGMGCAVVLLGVTTLGVIDAVRAASWDAFLGLPCTLVFALAFAVLGLTRGVSIIDRERCVVVNERRFLGVAIRRDVLPYGQPQAVVLDVLGRDRRPFLMVSVLGEQRQSEVLTQYDAEEARRVGARIAAHLGVPVNERTPLPEEPGAH